MAETERVGRDRGDAALVRNAADEKQVRRGTRLAVRRRERELNDLRAVLALPVGRRVLWRVLTHCRVFASIWDPSSRIHYQAGRQDVGHYLIAEIDEADSEAIFTLMREAKAHERAEALENVASRTPSAEGQVRDTEAGDD